MDMQGGGGDGVAPIIYVETTMYTRTNDPYRYVNSTHVWLAAFDI
jgi:hypothetical protein